MKKSTLIIAAVLFFAPVKTQHSFIAVIKNKTTQLPVAGATVTEGKAGHDADSNGIVTFQ